MSVTTGVTAATTRSSLSPSRVAAAVVLASWGALFWWLLIAERSALYLSSRTDWVVPVGAVILTIATIGRLASLRVDDPRPLTGRDWAVFGLLLFPVVATAALPPASLGSFAASRRSSFVSAGFASSVDDVAAGELSLVDVAGALRSGEAMRALVERAGERVSFIGFVDREPGMPADEFVLTRFLVSCCVADALSVQVRVVGAPPGEFAKDDWVRVSGNIYPLGREVIVDASEVVGVPRPKRPYLTP